MKILQRFNALKLLQWSLLLIFSPLIAYSQPCTPAFDYTYGKPMPERSCLYTLVEQDIGVSLTDVTYLSDKITDLTFLPLETEKYCIEVKGTFIMDVDDYFFYETTFKMHPGSEIIILNGYHIAFHTSRFYGTDGKMWKGIKTQNGSSIKFASTEIMDAEVALDLDEFSEYSIFRSVFASNRIGIQCLGDPFSDPLIYNSIIHGNNFYRHPGGFLDEYSGQTQHLDNVNPSLAYTYVAMLFKDAYFEHLTIECEMSWIKDHANGLILENASAITEGILFEDISTLSNYPQKGFGIYAENNTSNPLFFENKGFGWFNPDEIVDNYPTRNTFYRVHKGIEIRKYDDVIINFNRFKNIFQTGITAIQNDALEINGNKFHNYRVIGTLVTNTTTLNLHNNYFETGESTVANANSIKCLYINGPGTAPISTGISHNLIINNHGSVGIDFTYCNAISVRQNSIKSIIPNTNNTYGIKIYLSDDNLIESNLVTHVSSGVNNTNSAAILLDESEGNTIKCNYLENYYFGMFINDNCDNSEIITNTFYNSYSALRINNGGIIGTQPYHDNRWIGTYSGFEVEHLGTPAQVTNSQFTQKTADIGTDLFPNTHDPANFFVTSTGTSEQNECSISYQDLDERKKPLPLVYNPKNYRTPYNLGYTHQEISERTSIDDNSSSYSELLVFPNPSRSEINIYGISQDSEILFIFNEQGHKVFSTRNPSQNNLKIDINNFRPGLYFILTSSQRTKFLKL